MSIQSKPRFSVTKNLDFPKHICHRYQRAADDFPIIFSFQFFSKSAMSWIHKIHYELDSANPLWVGFSKSTMSWIRQINYESDSANPLWVWFSKSAVKVAVKAVDTSQGFFDSIEYHFKFLLYPTMSKRVVADNLVSTGWHNQDKTVESFDSYINLRNHWYERG